ncbi:OHP2 [Rhynchospora pubera]|uniref:OHP2 n=1 Tax=Rhynchospora pubera TaxID=906938 RepID=A0AAV8FVL9_9POAL|nr:OHP2 [Rhynchospora pubera]
MSLASSFPSIKLKLSPPSHLSKSTSTHRQLAIVRNSKADGPLRRPAAPSLSPPPSLSTPPSLSPPPSPTAPVKPSPPVDPTPAASPAPTKVAVIEADLKGAVTFEYQRKVAKELQDYFKQKKLEEADQGPPFGFVGKNEITNGRWAMFGFAVGMLTEYATGSDFVQQLKILLSNFGIVDLD